MIVFFIINYTIKNTHPEVEISANGICGEEPVVNDLAIDWILRLEETNHLQVR